MASIFTFDPDPPRVSSPWSTPRATTPKQSPVPGTSTAPPLMDSSPLRLLERDYHGRSITRLEAEPQDGPVEYKLHLLLRPRRSFHSLSTKWKLVGAQRAGRPTRTATEYDTSTTSSPEHPTDSQRSASESSIAKTPPVSASAQTRQHRLEQLTTQLLWRLQQSAPSQSGRRHESIIPSFPTDASGLTARSVEVGPLVPGLEESKGALYEIGVADDGTLVGLAEDELQESLDNLRAMAASLGCIVDIVRKVPVGQCRWYEDVDSGAKQSTSVLKSGELWVAEAYVKPRTFVAGMNLSPKEHGMGCDPGLQIPVSGPSLSQDEEGGSGSVGQLSVATQLRVCFVGATLSGKSSLLGTLTTGTLDNGRGKSRLSLLKHRHEIESGMTSSLTQELIGYRDDPETGQAEVINRAVDHVESWVDIYAAASPGRLLLLSDSAGHLRYRRTLLKGLVGWQPHWALVCVSADSTDNISGMAGATPTSHEILRLGAAGANLSRAHLELCLSMGLPLVVIITKLDVASKSGLRQTLSEILTVIKAAGRKPEMIPSVDTSVEPDLATLDTSDIEPLKIRLAPLGDDPTTAVPIVLTSAVNGRGIKTLHALLHELPVPAPPNREIEGRGGWGGFLNTLFRVEDVFPWRAIGSTGSVPSGPTSKSPAILSGLLDCGNIGIGDTLVLGPFLTLSSISNSGSDESGDDHSSGLDSPSGGSLRHLSHHHAKGHRSRYLSPRTHLVTSRSYPGALDEKSDERIPQQLRTSLSKNAWRPFRVVSVRNLQLPVQTLHAGQVGTVGVIPLDGEEPGRIRKGMVLANSTALPRPKARRNFKAQFGGAGQSGPPSGVGELQIGSMVLIYVGNVRASAKVLEVDPELPTEHDGGSGCEGKGPEGSDDAWGFDFEGEEGPGRDSADSGGRSTSVTVSFQFISTAELLESGAQVLVEPSGGPSMYMAQERGERGLTGLEFFIGRVVE